MGIEPTRPAWKAGILPLNYTRISFQAIILYHLLSDLSIGFSKLLKIFFINSIIINEAFIAVTFALGFYDIFQIRYIL